MEVRDVALRALTCSPSERTERADWEHCKREHCKNRVTRALGDVSIERTGTPRPEHYIVTTEVWMERGFFAAAGCRAGRRLQAAGRRLQAAGCRLQVTGRRPQAACRRLQGRPQVAGCRLHAAGRRLQAAGCRPQVAGRDLQAAGRRLPHARLRIES